MSGRYVLPPCTNRGCIPTLNNTGFQKGTTSMLIDEWINSYDGIHPLLDIGCAYGINTFKALELGIPTIALDMDSRHLEILQSNVDSKASALLTCVQGVLPSDIPIADSSVSGILLAEVLHCLTGEETTATLSTLFKKIVHGGRLILTTLSIHHFDDKGSYKDLVKLDMCL